MALILANGKQQFFDDTGNPLAGGKLWTMQPGPGVTTPKNTWTDAGETALNTNPIILNARGEAQVFWSGGYNVRLETAAGGLIYNVESINTEPSPESLDALLRADLANTTSSLKGAALVGLGPLEAFPRGTLGRGLQDVAYTPNGYAGVDATGATDSTAGLVAFFAAVPAGSLVRLSGTYRMGRVEIAKSLQIDARGASFTLVGNSAGFAVKGTVAGFSVFGGTYTGDGANRDGAPGTAQICWCIGNDSGAQVSDVLMLGLRMFSANIGIKVADGRGGGGTKARRVHVISCFASNMVGSVGGVGYGFQFAQADGSSITDSNAENCGRHGIYFSEGRGYTASNVTTRGCGNGSAVRGAFSISRSAVVVVHGYVADGNADCGLVIDTDAQGLAPDNVLDGVVVVGYVASNNALGDLCIGTSATPSTDGVPRNVSVTMRSTSTTGATASPVVIQSGERVRVVADIDATAAAASVRAVTLSAIGGATYSQDIDLSGDWNSAGYGCQIAAALQVGISRLRIVPEQNISVVAGFDFLLGEDATTNPSLFYRRSNGTAARTSTATGSNISIPVGSLTGLILSPASATTVATLSGGVEGDELLLSFTNSNTTIKATSIFLAGAVDFVGTANDTLQLGYRAGAWREISRSLN